MIKSALLIILTFLVSSCSAPLKAETYLNGVDVYGTEKVSSAELKSRYHDRLEEIAKQSDLNQEKFWDLKTVLSKEIQSQHDFYSVDLSLIRYFTPDLRFMTFDVVEKDAVWERLPFYEKPTETFEDPGGLIALWDEYLKLAFSLQMEGKFEFPKTCPAWHCVQGFEHPQLAKYLKPFNEGVARHQKKLKRIALYDKRANYRANALFLLAHSSEGQALVDLALVAIFDPSGLVRNNALRVLDDILLKHREFSLKLDPFLKALNFPDATDRNKASYALVSLSEDPQHRVRIARTVGPILISMLKLRQPNNRDPAYQILKNISGQNFDSQDYEAWETWLKTNAEIVRYVDSNGKILQDESKIASVVDRIFSGRCPIKINLKFSTAGTSQFYAPTSLIQIDAKSKSQNYKTVLAHETSHLCLHEATQGANVEEKFRFLDEGYASLVGAYASGNLESYRAKALTIAAREVKAHTISLSKLQKWSTYFGNPPQANWKAYEVSASFVIFLRETYGEGRLLQLFEAIGKTRNLNAALESAYEMEAKKIESSWLTYLRNFKIADPPQVVKFIPQDGEMNVSLDLKEILVEFDQPMSSIISFGGSCDAGLCYKNASWKNPRTLIVKASGRLRPGHTYQLSLGTKNGQLISKAGGELPVTSWKFTTEKVK